MRGKSGFWVLLFLALGVLGGWRCVCAAEPRVAVWEPGRSADTYRFRIDAAYLDRVAGWLRNAGVAADRLTAEQIADGATFSADRYDALMFEGTAIPAVCIEPIESFLDGGGVLVALCAPGPFELTIAQEEDGRWRLEPESPKFAWQTTAIYEALGMQFNWQLDMAYSAVHHTPTDLLRRYIPEAPEVVKNLMARWFVPTTGRFYPLIRSRQAGGADYTPQLYLVTNGERRAIISSGSLWTSREDPELWPYGPETVVAMARLARDLREGAVDPADHLTVAPPEEANVGGPLEWRLPVGEVDPEGAEPVARWGRFDGSRLEFGPALESGETRSLPIAPEPAQVPGSLKSGATLRLALPDLRGGPLYLRVRGAYAKDGAALSLDMGGETLWNENFVQALSPNALNIDNRYAGSPTEFTRIIYVPPPARSAAVLTLQASGSEPVYLDALQIERRTDPAPERGFGLHTGVGLAYDGATALTRDICGDWNWLRCTSRPWWIGAPDDPDRWKRFDAHMERYLALSDHCQVLLEGTPEWAAISPERWAEVEDRRHMMPPDTEAYRAIVERVVARYADRVEDWEIWNEANVLGFWRGTPQEFARLSKALVPIVRRLDPEAQVILGGMAGTTGRWVDPFVTTMVEEGVADSVDLFGFHCYAPRGLWDVAYGMVEGHLMSQGCDTEVYPNEQGYVWRRGGTPESQRRDTDIGMARLLACGAAKVTNFNAGGDTNEYGLLDEKARPRPAYAVFSDYLELAGGGARRLDVSMTSPDGSPLRGVYVAGSTADGRVALVVNPAEVAALRAGDDPSDEFDEGGLSPWHAFWGEAEKADGKVTLTVGAGRTHCGFYRRFWHDPARFPVVEAAVTDCRGRWTVSMKFADGRSVELASSDEPEKVHVALADVMDDLRPQEAEIGFRVFGGEGNYAAVDYLRFERAPVAQPEPVPVRIRLLLPSPVRYAVSVTGEGRAGQRELTAKRDGDRAWAELQLAVTGRSVVTLRPLSD